MNTAISVDISRKDPWHLARTLATQTGMTNQWLKDQGLVSVKELWVNIHYSRFSGIGSVNRPVRICTRGGVGRGS